MQKLLATGLLLVCVLSLWGCGKKKTMTCDGCGKPLEVAAASNVKEDRIVFCDACSPLEISEEKN